MHLPVAQTLQKLQDSGQIFQELYSHGTLTVEVYRPVKKDLQKPHNRDEIYVIIAGTGAFFNDGKTILFQPGDFLFVKAGAEHKFLDFSEDFVTWVFFYGPKGGEARKNKKI